MAGIPPIVVAEIQLSNGSWKLSTLAVAMATTKRDLEAKCPIQLSSSATMATVWATVVGITVLNQVSHQQHVLQLSNSILWYIGERI